MVEILQKNNCENNSCLPCTVSTNNDDKLKLYEAVPILKKYIKDPSEPKYVVIRMKPERIRLMAQAGKGYEDIEVAT
jgi:general stress protein 26